MDSRSKYERRLMYLIFLFCMCLFINLSIKEDPIDKVPLVLGGVLIVLITFGYFVIRKFYPDGDKYLLIFAAVLSIISIAVFFILVPIMLLLSYIIYVILAKFALPEGRLERQAKKLQKKVSLKTRKFLKRCQTQ